MSHLRAVLFDMDGTLTDTEELWNQALHEVRAAGRWTSRPGTTMAF